MRGLFLSLATLAVMALAFWAYRENYATQEAQRDLRRMNAEIADLREALAVQRAEWAYLNRPDRLRALADLNFDRLNLLPLSSEQLSDVALLPLAPAPLFQPTPTLSELPEVSQ